MRNQKIKIYDPTLRDGNHAVKHSITVQQIKAYAKAAEAAGVPVVEVGHGNGLGASSLQVGLAGTDDLAMIHAAREELQRSQLAVHCIPSFATINKNLKPAIDAGVDVVRIAAHCTEADITEKQIGYVRERGKEAYGTLMMSSMTSADRLAEECYKMESYGANAVIIMDSVGGYLPSDVNERISKICQSVKIPVGFHAHNNLGMAIANSLAAIESGAKIIDATARGFGAGAGNTQIEVLVAVLNKLGVETGIDLYKILDAAEIATKEIIKIIPNIQSTSIVSGLANVFSGFVNHVERVAMQYGVDARDIFFELGKRKVIAGQEDMIIEVAMDLSELKKNAKYK